MNYKGKRIRAGLSYYTVSKELGIEESKYREVEERKRILEGDLVDKFLEIIDNARRIKFDRRIRLLEIDRWYKDGRGEKQLKEYGYTMNSLADVLDVSVSNISYCFKGERCSDDIREKVYDFLNNQLNKKIPNKKPELKYIDVKKALEELNISQRELADESGVSQVTVSYLVTGTREVSELRKKAVYDAIERLRNKAIVEEHPLEEFIEDVIEEPIEEMVEENIGVEPVEETVVEEPVLEIEKIAPVEELIEKVKEPSSEELYIVELEEKVRKLERQIHLYEKLIERL